jgi:regulator of telomere elongation helicase 1
VHAAWTRCATAGGPSTLDRLRKLKSLFIEPRDGSECAEMVEGFHAAVAASVKTGVGGALLLAVCRGKLSEGVDFSDAACRGVVVTGLPLPPFYNARVALKREFLDKKRAGGAGRASEGQPLSGEEWSAEAAVRLGSRRVYLGRRALLR